MELQKAKLLIFARCSIFGIPADATRKKAAVVALGLLFGKPEVNIRFTKKRLCVTHTLVLR